MNVFSDTVRYSLAAIFFLTACLHVFAPKKLTEFYWRRDVPVPRILAILLGLSALFLLVPHTHVWGVILAGLVLFCSIIAMLNRGHFAIAMVGIVVLGALPIAIIAGPTS